MTGERLLIRTAIDRTPLTEALFVGRISSPRVAIEFVPVKPITRAFRRMVRDLEFDVCEMALATQAIAHAFGKPIALLPAPLVRETPLESLVCLKTAPFRDPGELAGKRIAARAYSQTTAVWLRSILRHEYGVDPASVVWLTQEDSHVAELPVFPGEVRLEPGMTLDAALETGLADAAVTMHLGRHAAIRTVLDHAAQAGAGWQARHGLQPINHLVALQSRLLQAHPWLGAELVRLFEASRRAAAPDGADPMPWDAPGAALLLHYVAEQRLTPVAYGLDALFAALPPHDTPQTSPYPGETTCPTSRA